jgi:hypothetical protein
MFDAPYVEAVFIFELNVISKATAPRPRAVNRGAWFESLVR